MEPLPRDLPAELHRRGRDAPGGDVVVASGPLAIMAQGLLALAPEDRATCWIHSAAGDLDAAEAAEQVQLWSELPH